jgi:hypothetical protein
LAPPARKGGGTFVFVPEAAAPAQQKIFLLKKK